MYKFIYTVVSLTVYVEEMRAHNMCVHDRANVSGL